jgi:hypothetical protein
MIAAATRLSGFDAFVIVAPLTGNEGGGKACVYRTLLNERVNRFALS